MFQMERHFWTGNSEVAGGFSYWEDTQVEYLANSETANKEIWNYKASASAAESGGRPRLDNVNAKRQPVLEFHIATTTEHSL